MSAEQAEKPLELGPLLRLLEDLCAISSATGDVAALQRMAARTAQLLAALGLEVQLEPTPSGPILAALAPSAQPPYTLLLGHMDTVLPARPVRCAEGRLYGSGAVDMKGGIATLIRAVELLRQQHKPLPQNLAVVLVPDEESSGVATRKAMASWGPHAGLVLVLEPGDIVDGRETVVCGRKGMAEFLLRVHGHPAHSGLAFHEGRSALGAACWFVQRAEALTQDGVTVNVSRLVAGDRTFVDNLAQQAEVMGTSTRLNVVPDTAVCQGECRFPENWQGEQAKNNLLALAQEVASQREVAVELSITEWVPALTSRTGARLAELAQQLAKHIGFELAVEHERGGVSLVNFLDRPDLPVLDGLGPVGGGMHTEDEFVDLRSLSRRVLLLAGLLEALATPPSP